MWCSPHGSPSRTVRILMRRLSRPERKNDQVATSIGHGHGPTEAGAREVPLSRERDLASAHLFLEGKRAGIPPPVDSFQIVKVRVLRNRPLHDRPVQDLANTLSREAAIGTAAQIVDA